MLASPKGLPTALQSTAYLEALPVPAYVTDADGFLVFCNRAATEFAGRDPVLGVDRWCVTSRLYSADGTPVPHHECPMARALRDRRPVEGEEMIAERPDGTRARCLPHPVPLFDEQGELAGGINVITDVTERYEASVETAHLAAIVQSSRDAIISKTLDGRIRSWNAGATAIFGYEPDEIIGKPITTIIPEDLQFQEGEIISRIRAGERVEHFETVRRTRDGRLIDVSLAISPIRDRNGGIVGASKVARDITEQKKAEDLRRRLIAELNHRVKNTLTVVQSVARQSFRGATSPGEGLDRFENRLHALATGHDLLARNNWTGATLHEIVAGMATSFVPDTERLHVTGPDVTLEAKQAIGMAMALHELATNALKHGALSSHKGTVQIDWNIESVDERRQLVMVWKEAGGPPVCPPTRSGLGTRMLSRGLVSEFGSAPQLAFEATGVVCTITVQLMS